MFHISLAAEGVSKTKDGHHLCLYLHRKETLISPQEGNPYIWKRLLLVYLTTFTGSGKECIWGRTSAKSATVSARRSSSFTMISDLGHTALLAQLSYWLGIGSSLASELAILLYLTAASYLPQHTVASHKGAVWSRSLTVVKLQDIVKTILLLLTCTCI